MIEARKNVLVTRYDKSWVGGPDHSQIPDHGRIRGATGFRDVFEPTVRAREPRIESGTFLYGGPLKVHFGHLMVDSVARLWAFDPARHQQVVFAKLQETKEPSDWMYEILSVFGLAKEQVRLVRGAAKFETLEFAIPGSRLAVGPSLDYMHFLETLPLHRQFGTPKKVYFGRTHILEKGTIMGESYFAKALKIAGYEYIIPETMNIHEQTSLLKNADSVVFLEGSSIYSIEMLSTIGANVFMIPRRDQTSHLFDPHISPRAPFAILGDPSMTVRMPSPKGSLGPNSPTYLLKPARLYADMQARGIVTGDFSLREYENAEQLDADRYFLTRPEIVTSQLDNIRSRRRALA
ncbi:glycosyltransferase 61 family protein [Sphingomonas sp. Leaf38]|uniref:glycosyltransferase 61 family protein n=1 Tax=Sphingomonas sp. Leaf38 TaxID=1736217 RepID=UPI0009EBD384|nr:glycosyltransferase 61 family protein [Sphingomonas sp. Leaf38]